MFGLLPVPIALGFVLLIGVLIVTFIIVIAVVASKYKSLCGFPITEGRDEKFTNKEKMLSTPSQSPYKNPKTTFNPDLES